MEELMEQIGTSAGEIYNYLNTNGTTTFSKMKKEFPAWKYISPDASGVSDPNIVENADYIYFYTDVLTHSTYYRFINIIRDHKIPFGYIHSVNIENAVRSIYQDQIE